MQMNKEDIINSCFSGINKDIDWLREHTFFLVLHGSHCYGLNTPESDVDVRGINTLPKQYLHGFNKSYEQLVRKDPDCQIFSAIKFFRLTAQNNPNTLELLFVEPEEHLYVGKLGELLLSHREKFLSKQIKARYLGFSKAQAHRIAQHKKWLTSGINHKPTRQECDLPERPLIAKNQYDAIKSMINKKMEEWNPHFEPFSESQKIYLNGKVSDILAEMHITINNKWEAAARTIGFDENIIDLIRREKVYEQRLGDWHSYCEWKKNRNPKRAALEEKYGFDLKHATQLIRLLKLGKEALDTGKLQVKRTHDREELMAIKNGAWSYENVVDYADKLEAEVEQSYKNSPLPNMPDMNMLDKLCQEIMESAI